MKKILNILCIWFIIFSIFYIIALFKFPEIFITKWSIKGKLEKAWFTLRDNFSITHKNDIFDHNWFSQLTFTIEISEDDKNFIKNEIEKSINPKNSDPTSLVTISKEEPLRKIYNVSKLKKWETQNGKNDFYFYRETFFPEWIDAKIRMINLNSEKNILHYEELYPVWKIGE